MKAGIGLTKVLLDADFSQADSDDFSLIIADYKVGFLAPCGDERADADLSETSPCLAWPQECL